jgi:tRNA nucleotidyltransferase/poly(A) polymerase
MDLSSPSASKAVGIVRALRQAGHDAYLAGGCVRDFLLARPPKDLDIATSASPRQITGLFSRVLPVGEKYGVVCVLIDGDTFEVTTFRRDLDYQDGRHPTEVEFSDPRQDALRRDFTINGMFYDPLEAKLIDYVGGEKDLRDQIIRTIGDPLQRFAEDRLRMMRAVRFSCQLGFGIDSRTFSAIRAHAEQILSVSWERIRDELLKALTSPRPAEALDLLDQSRLLEILFPEVHAMHGVEQPPQFHPEGDVFVHTRLMLANLRHPTATLSLGILLHDVGKPLCFEVKERIRFDLHVELGTLLAADICGRLRLSNELSQQVGELVRHHLRFMHVPEMRESTLKRFLRLEHFDEHLELHRLDCLASHGDLSTWEFCSRKLQELSSEQVAPPPLLNGRDLIGMGFTPGPQFGQILVALEDAQLEGRVADREAAIRFVSAHFNPGTQPHPDQELKGEQGDR